MEFDPIEAGESRRRSGPHRNQCNASRLLVKAPDGARPRTQMSSSLMQVHDHGRSRAGGVYDGMGLRLGRALTNDARS